MDRITLADISKVGPGIWFKIHTDAVAAITDTLKESFIVNINALCDGFKCLHCKPHFRKFIDDNPIKNYFNIKDRKGRDIGIFQWTWELHNSVNLRLGKYQPLLEEAYEYFTNNKVGVCYDCGNKNKNVNINISNNIKNANTTNINTTNTTTTNTNTNTKNTNNINTNNNGPLIIRTENDKKTTTVKNINIISNTNTKFVPYTFKATENANVKSFPFKMYDKK
jgi:hypothetical protein